CSVCTDDGFFVAGPVSFSVHSQHGNRNFQYDGVNVETGNSIRRVIVGIVGVDSGAQNSSHTHPKVERIESRAQIDIERIVDGSCEYANSISKVVDTLIEEVIVIRHRKWPDVRGNGIKWDTAG